MLINKNLSKRILRIVLIVLGIIFLLIFTCAVIYNIILTVNIKEIANASLSDYQNPVICDNLQVHFVDVGQGDGTIIINKDKVVVIDTGPLMRKFKMKNYLKLLGVKRINALIITHPHQDHFGGLDAILCNFKVDKIYTTEITDVVDKSFFEKLHLTEYNTIVSKYTEYNGEDKLEVINSNNLKEISIGDIELKFLGPLKSYEIFNDNSIVTRMDYKNISILFPGDIQFEAEYDLLRNNADLLDVDILKIAHHGSKTSTSSAFLKTVNPSIAVISCAFNNDNWHPHARVAQSLEDNQISLFRTDEQGTIVFHTDGYSVFANTEEGDYKSGITLSTR